MTTVAAQVRCPCCNAAQAAHSAGSYTCEFCLQPFSVEDAQREEGRLVDEIKAWIEQRVGAAGPASGVDVTSRAYIFQQRVLPDLRRDVDRALERLGGYAQFPLVSVPVRVTPPLSRQENPLVVHRREILGLKGLKARLAADDVTAFAIRDADKLVLRHMDRHLASLVHLSNVAEAAAARTTDGYAAARRNLEAIGEDVARSVTTEGAHDPALGAFLVALGRRYRALAEVCRICEEAGSNNATSGTALAGRAEDAASELTETARHIEASNYAPADTMPVVVAVHQEAAAARALGRWLRAYDRITNRAPVPFPAFLAELDPLTGGGSLPAEDQAELLEAVAFVLSGARGAATAPVVADFSWVEDWAEGGRKKRALGIFGVAERIASVERLLAPFWVAEVSFSRAQGAVFTSGQEHRAVALLDACAPTPQRVVILGAGALADGLSTEGSLLGAPLALPRSGPSQAAAIMTQALRGRPENLNPRLRVRGLAFLATASVTYEAEQRQRTITACLNQRIPVDDLARLQVKTTEALLTRYG